jgi:lysophospholipid acyltransferase (LPLAT)-like uncharacterized protein
VPVLWSRRIWRWRWTQKAVALAGAKYFHFVFRTNRPVVPPEEFYALVEPDLPIILVMWHGQHFLAPFIRRPADKSKALISHHSDGEMTALTAERLGVEVIRGSGDPHGRFDRKGGVAAFFQMIEALKEGYTVALTADVPKIALEASPGLVSRKRVRTSDIPDRAGDQPAGCARQLGSHHHQSPVRTLGCRTGRARSRASPDR